MAKWMVMELWFLERCWLFSWTNWETVVSSRLTLLYGFFYHGTTAPSGPRPPHYQGFMITLRHTTLGRTCLDEWPARLRDLYLTTHNAQETKIHASDGIWTHNPSKRAAADPHLWPRGHWDRCLTDVVNCYFSHLFIDVRNEPLYRCLSSLITFFTCRCIQYPFLPVLASRTPS
jgi:hypothetical protein